MKDGTLRLTSAIPLSRPRPAPSRIATRIPSSPQSLSFLLLATRSATAIAEAPITPGTERSIDPIISTKVMPQATTASTAAASMMFCRLPTVRKSELRAAKTAKMTTSAIGGPASRRDTPRRGRGRGGTTTSVSALAGDVMVTRWRPASG